MKPSGCSGRRFPNPSTELYWGFPWLWKCLRLLCWVRDTHSQAWLQGLSLGHRAQKAEDTLFPEGNDEFKAQNKCWCLETEENKQQNLAEQRACYIVSQRIMFLSSLPLQYKPILTQESWLCFTINQVSINGSPKEHSYSTWMCHDQDSANYSIMSLNIIKAWSLQTWYSCFNSLCIV